MVPRQYASTSSLALVLLVAGGALADTFDEMRASNWHQWRGPYADGVAPRGNPPLNWSASENIRWKAAIPGLGNAGPIIWGSSIYLITAVDTGKVDPSLPPPSEQPDRPFGIKYPNTIHEYVVLCLDRATGQERWKQVAAARVPNEGHHRDNSFASASPTTDGKNLYAWFGAGGLFCYDLQGELVWQRDLGEVTTRLSFGEGASPVVHGDRLILVRDHEAQSYIEVFDTNNGETVWQQLREEPSCWATPLVIERDGVTQVITNGKTRVRSYNLENGDLLWECGGQVSNVTPSPVSTTDTVFCMSGYSGAAIFALPLNARGDISNSDKIRWSKSRGTPYVPSPLLYNDLLYYNQQNDGLITCVDAESGELIIDRKRMPGIRRMYASPVGAADRIYVVGRNGTTLVLAHGREFKELARNPLGEDVDASPAIVDDQLFIRGKQHLYCIAESN